jgi:hypothetical protein
MAAALTQPTRDFDSERLRRRRERHVRLAADRALAEVAFALRARERRERGAGHGLGTRPVTDRAPHRRAAASSR